MAAPADGTVLIVCAANVCRSPFAAHLLGGMLPHARVLSAGVTARAGDELCRFTSERIRALPGGAEFVDAHVATRLDAALIDRADLILTASEAERSAVAVSVPGARARAFTLVEAAHSARHLGPAVRTSALSGLAAAMHAQRGRVPLPTARPRRLLRAAGYGIAIPDAHIGETQKHAVVYQSIEDAVEILVGAIEPDARRAGSR